MWKNYYYCYPLIVGLLVLLIIYRDHFNLGVNPLDYIEIIFEATAITIVQFVHKDILQLATFVLI